MDLASGTLSSSSAPVFPELWTEAPAVSRTPPDASLTGLAWANVFLHVAGLTLAAFGMSPGTPLVPLPQRLEYLSAAPWGWTLGWAAWMACGVLLVAFLAAVADRLGRDNGPARLGLAVAVAGVTFDLFCDSVYIAVFPLIASARPPAELLFLAVERLTAVGSLVIANGAYSVAALLFSRGLRRQGRVGRGTVGLGYGVGAAGLLLAAAGFTNVPWHAAWGTAATIGLYCVWVVLVARGLTPEQPP